MVGTSAGVSGVAGESGELDEDSSSSRFIALSSFLAFSNEAAKFPPWYEVARDKGSLIDLSGTTTTGPPVETSIALVVILESLRIPGLGLAAAEGLRVEEGAILNRYKRSTKLE